MNTHEYAVVTETTLKTYRLSGFEAGNIFQIQSRTKRYDETIINLICPDGLIRGYQERFFDVRKLHEPTAEEIISKRLTAALVELKEIYCLKNPGETKRLEDLVRDAPPYHESHIEDVSAILCDFLINECDEELFALVDQIQPFEEEAEV